MENKKNVKKRKNVTRIANVENVFTSIKSTKFGSRYLVDRWSKGDEIWQIDRGGLHRCRDW